MMSRVVAGIKLVLFVVCGIAFLSVIGVAGSLELGTVSLLASIKQASVGLIVIFVSISANAGLNKLVKYLATRPTKVVREVSRRTTGLDYTA